jgi:anti-sigma factor RsiW
VTSRETDLQDREARREHVDRNLAEARAGRDRLRDLADQPAPDERPRSRNAPTSGNRRGER